MRMIALAALGLLALAPAPAAPPAPAAVFLAQVVVPPGGARPPGTLPPGVLPRDRRAECRQKCTDDWETARQACLALTGAVVVRDCLEEILATRDECYAAC